MAIKKLSGKDFNRRTVGVRRGICLQGTWQWSKVLTGQAGIMERSWSNGGSFQKKRKAAIVALNMPLLDTRLWRDGVISSRYAAEGLGISCQTFLRRVKEFSAAAYGTLLYFPASCILMQGARKLDAHPRPSHDFGRRSRPTSSPAILLLILDLFHRVVGLPANCPAPGVFPSLRNLSSLKLTSAI